MLDLVVSLETRLECLSNRRIVSKLLACNRHEYFWFLNKQFLFIVVIIVQIGINTQYFFRKPLNKLSHDTDSRGSDLL